MMDAVCNMTGEATTWPCQAPGCPLYWDCLSEYEKNSKPPRTNAQKIRSMSDEELAVFLESSRGCPTDDDCEYGVHATPENCIKHWTTWLQQLYEGE